MAKLFEPDDFTVPSNELVNQYLTDLTLTGLYGRNSRQTAAEIIRNEIRRLIAEGVLAKRDSFTEVTGDAE